MKALSFGLAVDENVSPPGTAVEVASSRGIDLSMHRSRSINELEPAPNDFVLVMEPPMLGPTRDRLRHGANVALLGLCGRSGPTIPYIPDPLGLSEPVFSAVYDIIDHCVQGLAAER
jgi:protein-tyrosine-phosphatase